MPTILTRISDAISGDPGLVGAVSPEDLAGGLEASSTIAAIVVEAIETLGLNGDGHISESDVRAINNYIREDAARLADFIEAHGDDDGATETGFHLIQNDGGTSVFKGLALIDTVIDAIYHIGFAIDEATGRFVNEDGNQNEKVADVADWLNFFVNGTHQITGSATADTLTSGAYSPAVVDAANELFDAQDGDDSVNAGAGHDAVFGGNGNDTLEGGAGYDQVFGGAGNDTIYLSTVDTAYWGLDTAYGGDGDDFIVGSNGASRLYGDAGNDTLNGGADGHTSDRDTLDGGDGDDFLISGQDVAPELGTQVFGDLMLGGDGNDSAIGGLANDTIEGGAGYDSLQGGGGDDVIYTSGQRSNHWGLDTASGGDGNDFLMGSNGATVLYGDAGNDTLNGGADGHTADRDTLDGGDGNDLLISGQTTQPELGTQIYGDLMLGGTGNDTAFGGLANDTIKGGSGSDVLMGDAGDDYISGGTGQDMITAGDGADTIMGGQGGDQIMLMESSASSDILIMAPGDSGGAAMGVDNVFGFVSGEDKVDLSMFDLMSFVGDGMFVGGGAASVRYEFGILQMDADGDGLADQTANFFQTESLAENDFIFTTTAATRYGNDTIIGTAADEVIISRADSGEPVIAQDPTFPTYFDDQPYEDADDWFEGGTGADTFVFQFDINAKRSIVEKHVNANGTIDWMGVAGENGNLHDHWVDGIGDDTIADYSVAEGDQIELNGHTVDIGNVEYLDSDEDGIDDYTLITVISNQGGNGGAHDQDVLGTITVYGDLVDEADISLTANVAYGVVDTLDDWISTYG